MRLKSNTSMFVLLISLCCIISFTIQLRAEVVLGSSEEEVIAEFGKPTGELNDGKQKILSYPGGIISIKDKKVVHIDDNFQEKLQQRRKEDILKAKQRPQSRTSGINNAGTAAANQKKVVIISDAGKGVDLQDILVPGKVTIVDFFADWCGPCRSIAPHIERLAASDPDVYLRKIDIVRWGTPVTQQFNINSIPDIRVFDRQGRLVGQPTYNFQQIQDYVRKAK